MQTLETHRHGQRRGQMIDALCTLGDAQQDVYSIKRTLDRLEGRLDDLRRRLNAMMLSYSGAKR